MAHEQETKQIKIVTNKFSRFEFRFILFSWHFNGFVNFKFFILNFFVISTVFIGTLRILALKFFLCNHFTRNIKKNTQKKLINFHLCQTRLSDLRRGKKGEKIAHEGGEIFLSITSTQQIHMQMETNKPALKCRACRNR